MKIKDSVIKIDSNRLFTPIGRIRNLTNLNPQLSKQPKKLETAREKAAKLSEFILKQLLLDRNTTLITTHNNITGYDFDGENGEGTVSIIPYQIKLDRGAKILSKVFHGKHDKTIYFI